MDQKLPHQPIAGLVQGLVFDGYYLLNDIRVKMSRAGNPYLSGSLMDTSGNIPVVIWNYTGEITADDAGKVVFVDGTVDEYNTMFEDLKSGNLVVDNAEVSDPSTVTWNHVTFAN